MPVLRLCRCGNARESPLEPPGSPDRQVEEPWGLLAPGTHPAPAGGCRVAVTAAAKRDFYFALGFSLNRPTWPIQSLSRYVRQCVCLCVPLFAFSPNRPTGSIWSSSCDVHICIYVYIYKCPLEHVFFSVHGLVHSWTWLQIHKNPKMLQKLKTQNNKNI